MKLLEIAIAVHIDEKMRSNWDPIGSLSNLIKVEVDFRCKLILRVCEMHILGKIAGQFANYFQVKNYVHHKQPHLSRGVRSYPLQSQIRGACLLVLTASMILEEAAKG